jgi:ATP-dependent DNA helicase RecQ
MTDGEGDRLTSLLKRCVSIDLEVSKPRCPEDKGQIRQLAIVRGDTGLAFKRSISGGAVTPKTIEEFCQGADFVLGHNIVAFDIPFLNDKWPDCTVQSKPAIDTLRLSPLAFPRNPYHHLVKHYQDGQLNSGQINNPELDARLVFDVLREQHGAIVQQLVSSSNLVTSWHWLSTTDPNAAGFDEFFSSVRGKKRPSRKEAIEATIAQLAGNSCRTFSNYLIADFDQHSWSLAFALAWISVAGENSAMPPWVRHQFPKAGQLVRSLRDANCQAPECEWCSENHDPVSQLRRWFGYDGFRPLPKGPNGQPLQQVIVEAAMRGEHSLGILPTGTGKSICYQLPALSRYEKTGALTVVISPLVALMEDQVRGLELRGVSSCKSINSLLSMPERSDALDKIRLGEVSILIISPEQLRSSTVRKVLAQREICMWVLDEAHCISKWGHDFRPDYRYIARFIHEQSCGIPTAPILCLTATAKPDVIREISDYFKEKVDVSLNIFNGGSERQSLDFMLMETTPFEKQSRVYQVIEQYLPSGTDGGAIVYCSTRNATEEMAEFLNHKGMPSGFYHAGLQPDRKRETQENFLSGELRTIAATNAFGMGIDKPDIRLVVHADIPGSLENYLQEAGRAGRDGDDAHCILLYTKEDVERQFSMSARSRLTKPEISAILKAISRLDRKGRYGGHIVATSGEILHLEETGSFERDSATDDTRVRTAISWLEESGLLKRDENRVSIFPSSLRIRSIEEARRKIERANLFVEYRKQLLEIVRTLIDADPDDGVTTDELMGISGLSAEKVRKALHDLEQIGIASNDTALTAFVNVSVPRASKKVFQEAADLEEALISHMREQTPDLGRGDRSILHVRHTTQLLKNDGHGSALPLKIKRLVRSIAADGRGEGFERGSFSVREVDAESIDVTLNWDWNSIEGMSQRRRKGARLILEHLLSTLPDGSRGSDLLATSTIGNIRQSITEDLVLASETNDVNKLLDRALLWLHEQEIVRLNKGLAVFRPAMTLTLDDDRKLIFTESDFEPLRLHYEEQVSHVHVMAQYAERGLDSIVDAVQLAMDYFSLDQEEFFRRWMPGIDVSKQTTPQTWHEIVDSLNNATQKRIVSDHREQTNVLVLAGPGSGKTRALVHRIAYLVRVKRENARGILALAYNRHAAGEIRKRLYKLIGDDAKGVSIMTCHAMAMRLVGASFKDRTNAVDESYFDNIIRDAVALLKGDGLAPEEVDEQRERLLAGYRWILVDEYQDIGKDQYELISALAGRTLNDQDGKLTLFAVGDDDQNIYSFRGASVEFIRQFEADYSAKPSYLTENYRSSGYIIEAANAVISCANNRMKMEAPIKIDRARSREPKGGQWERLDPIGKGRTLIIGAGADRKTQAVGVIAELQRLALLDDNWRWERTAIIAREWSYLWPIRSCCEELGIPVQMADEDGLNFSRLREVQSLLEWLASDDSQLIDASRIMTWLEDIPESPWNELVAQAIEDYSLETSGTELSKKQFREWLAEWGREARRSQSGLLLVSAHRAKGLEFDTVAVLDGGWDERSQTEDQDASRRLYYVAMTRARKLLLTAEMNSGNAFVKSIPLATAVKRPMIENPELPEKLDFIYMKASLRDIHIGYPGNFDERNPIHDAIKRISTTDEIELEFQSSGVFISNATGQKIGKMAGKYRVPDGFELVSVRVFAVISHSFALTEPRYQDSVRCSQWEVIVPEFVYRRTAERRGIH